MNRLEFDLKGLTRRPLSALLTGCVIPRPVAWVSTISPNGEPNLAPHSYFNVASNVPPIVYFVSSNVGDTPDSLKDSLRNVRHHPEFVISIGSQRHVQAMAVTASRVPPGIDEASIAGLEMAPSTRVSPPRVADCPVALECTVTMVLSIGSGSLVFGEIVHASFAEGVLKEPINDLSELVAGGIDAHAIDPIIRLGGQEYATLGDIFEVSIPSWDDLRSSAPAHLPRVVS